MSKPTQEMFRDAARDVTAWRAKAVALRAAATALWDSFMDFFHSELTASETKIATAIQQGSARIHTSQLLYGLATETALKARIIESDPESIEFVEIKAADGSIMDVSIKKIGVSLGADGHDLIKLAEVAQILNPSNTNLFAVISDLERV